VIKTFPKRHSVFEELSTEDSDESTHGDSLHGACQFTKQPTSPFSSKRVMYDNEEVMKLMMSVLLVCIALLVQLVMPGDRKEMSDFQDKALNSTLMSFEMNFPNINVIIPEKDVFETLYNRYLTFSMNNIAPSYVQYDGAWIC
jgi:hypothetical protein